MHNNTPSITEERDIKIVICPHTIYMCFVFIPEQIATLAPYNIK